MPNLTSKNYEAEAPYQQANDLRYDNHEKYSQIVEEIASSYIDDVTLQKIKQNTTLSIYDLLTPIENHRTPSIPRPQNSFVIYRRNLQAKMALAHNANTTFEKLEKISRIAGKKWKSETKDVRELYAFIADCAKKVHGKIFPGYVYNPRKNSSTKTPMKKDKDNKDSTNKNKKDVKNLNYFYPPYSPYYYYARINSINSVNSANSINLINSVNNLPPFNYNIPHPNSPHNLIHPNVPSVLLPPTLEINPDFMKSYDNNICRVLNKNTREFFL
jgi:hypothetical protein